MNLTYLRLEILRVLRLPQMVAMTVGLPVALFVVFAALFDGSPGGISATAYTMQSMAAYGSLGTAMFSAAAIALERRIGWNRQLRLTPLPPLAYVLVKGMAAWLLALLGLVPVYIAGAVGGVTLPAWQWAALIVTTWAALSPFVLLGIALGFIGTNESVQAVTSVLLLTFAFLGGMWFPVEVMPDLMQTIARLFPSYWLNAFGRAVMGASAFTWAGVAVLLGWTAAIAAVAVLGYRADAKRA
jgi:ABC-2 type transport system permease protein